MMHDIATSSDHAAEKLAGLLEETQQSIGIAESLTGGLLVQALARLEGSGTWLAGGIVAYQRSVKHELLEVSADKVVSREAAGEMATAARERFGSDVGLAVTGVAGPGSQDGETPGTVWIAVDAGAGPTTQLTRIDGGDAEDICRDAVTESLLFATRELQAARHHRHDAAPPGLRTSEGDEPVGFFRRNALSIASFSIFAVFLIAQSLTGWRAAVSDAVEHGGRSFGYWHYLTTGHFAEATLENWESEFLQMGAFVLLTIFLLQKGSGESKRDHDDPRDDEPREHSNDPDAPWPVRRGGFWLVVYENSLLIAFTAMFVGSFIGHAVSGAHEFTAEQHEHGSPGVSAWQFIRHSEFWFQSFQNWQSEFLAVGTIVTLSVFLRQRGSAESKPVHAPNRQSGDD